VRVQQAGRESRKAQRRAEEAKMALKEIKTQESVSPNLVPMVDIVFLILLFFMLSADMTQHELEDVYLPTANDVKEDDQHETKKGELPRITVNIYHASEQDGVKCANYGPDKVCSEEAHWRIGVRGKDYGPEAIKELLQKQAELDPDPQDPKLSQRKVMIRADASALYGYVQKVMNACAEVGLYKVEIGAATKAETAKVQ
jgi:biopolymer transport protein ExbD